VRREVIVALIVVVVLVALAGVVLITAAARSETAGGPAAPRPEAPPDSSRRPAPPPEPKPIPMAFGREGVADAVTTTVERVVGKGKARVALVERGDARWVCIVADGPKRYAELDRGLSAADFPSLAAAGFVPPPPHITRAASSIYRSVAKSAMNYDAARGDRIIVVLCPQDQWDGLALAWPAPPSQ